MAWFIGWLNYGPGILVMTAIISILFAGFMMVVGCEKVHTADHERTALLCTPDNTGVFHAADHKGKE